MGVEPFLVAASTSGLVAQRLVRRVCRDCGHEQPVSKREQELFAAESVPLSLFSIFPRYSSARARLSQAHRRGGSGRLGLSHRRPSRPPSPGS
ncbi:ATPase, T2SS/T4P/T4SS family [Acinetobacter soli]